MLKKLKAYRANKAEIKAKKQKEKQLRKEKALKKEEAKRIEDEKQLKQIIQGIENGIPLLFKGGSIYLDENIEPCIRVPRTQKVVCDVQNSISLYQNAQRITRLNNSSTRVRIPIVKGVSHTFGSHGVKTKQESYMKLIATGTITITNTNIFHNGDTKVTKIPLKKIIETGVDSSGLTIKKDTGKPVTFAINPKAAEFILMVLDIQLDNLSS